MLDWLRNHEGMLWALGAATAVVTFIGSLVVVPLLVTRIPADYFAPRRRRRRMRSDRHPLVHVLLLVAKNLLGVLLIAAGIAMLLLPGQGILTILVGLLLSDFPGKYRLERWFVRRPAVERAINWMRRRAGRPPLELELDPVAPRGAVAASRSDKEEGRGDGRNRVPQRSPSVPDRP